jgi:O-antigen ligase
MAEEGRFGVGGADPNSWACAAVIIFLVTYFGVERHKVAVYVSAPVLLYGIFASQSRTALLALVVTPLLAFLFVRRLATGLGGRTLLMYGLGAAVIVGVTLVIPAVGDSVLERYLTLSQYQEENTWSGRWSIWQGAFTVIASHPIAGVGVGNFGEVAVQYSTFLFEQTAGEEGETAGVAHNTFLSMASELGLVGLTLFLGVLFLAFKVAISAGRRSVLGIGLFLGLVAYVIASMSLTWESQKVGYIILGSVLALEIQRSRQPAPEGGSQDRS